MADIAFLLLIFFLVTTTMDVDSGIPRKLPAKPLEDEPDPPPIHARNIYIVVANQNNDLLVEEKQMDVDDLKDAAIAVRENAYAPYSNFKVGAALITEGGEVFAGCNVENVAYPEGTCAEAGAVAAMVAAGETMIAEVAVIADSPIPVSPCGGCRQKLAEFGAGDVVVTLATTDGTEHATTIADLLPGVFSQEYMERT